MISKCSRDAERAPMGCGQRHVRVILFPDGAAGGALGPDLQVDRRALMILQSGRKDDSVE